MEERWNRYLDALENRLLKVEDFAAEQIPDVAREWLSWEFWSNLAIVGVFILLAIFFFRTAIGFDRLHDKAKQEKTDPDGPAIACLVSFVLVFGSLGSAGFFGFKVAKVCIAPKVVLLEKLADVVKGRK